LKAGGQSDEKERWRANLLPNRKEEVRSYVPENYRIGAG